MPYPKYTSFTLITKLGSHFGHTRALLAFLPLLVMLVVCTSPSARAQDSVTGAFIGYVHDANDKPLAGAVVQFLNKDTNAPRAKITDNEGRFYQGLLNPGTYEITVTLSGFITVKKTYSLAPTRDNQVIPVPITLVPEGTPTTATTGTTTTTTTTTGTGTAGTTGGTAGNAVNNEAVRDDSSIQGGASDARRGGAYTQNQVQTLPLGGTTLVRSFDELALLLPGVASPPQSEGGGTGPGVGAGVGTSGQFSVNGLRSRANNFMVDGSDNNDEDIGVRRQGFFTLVPQPIESIREFTVISLLAPAQYGRNMGAQVNAVSRSGGNQFHGTMFGMYNNSQLNAPNFFDSTSGNTTIPLTGTTPGGVVRNVYVGSSAGTNFRQQFVTNNAGGEDSFALGQGGAVLGGPIVPNKLFFFVSAERQALNANKESNFAVPTVGQRGAFRTGASGLSTNPFTGAAIPAPGDYPTTAGGDAIFSLIPFPNNPTGVYGANTLTQVLPASARGSVVSVKLDYNNFRLFGHASSFTGRYNFTDDWRDIPVTGGGVFSSLRPRVRTQNFSTFLNSELSGSNSTSPMFNQLRLSYGRTRLKFDELRNDDFLLPIARQFNAGQDGRFLLNARLLENFTLPVGSPCPGVCYQDFGTTEEDSFPTLGPIGQLKIAGFSPVGVDVFNFPQTRVNNTYQVADTVTWRNGAHSLTFGMDTRRTELNSELPRNSRPLVTFNGARRSAPLDASMPNCNLRGCPNGFVSLAALNPYIRPEDYAAAGAASGFFQSLALPGHDSRIDLRYYQIDGFGQDEWRVRPNLSLTFGLRYEFNTTPQDTAGRIENTFSAPLDPLVSGLSNFIDGRTKIFDSDKNNFAPRIGIAYSPRPNTVIRAGYGMYFDQILGAVVSQSRNVHPTFTTINFGGGLDIFRIGGPGFNLFNPLTTNLNGNPLIQDGTLNTLNLPAGTTFHDFLQAVFNVFPFAGSGRPFGETLPERKLKTPMAHQYTVSVEHQFSRGLVVSGAYVGTLGRDLLRSTTPNLGPNYLTLTDIFQDGGGGSVPIFLGTTVDPGGVTPNGTFSATQGRPNRFIGPISSFESSAKSRYDALQVEAHGRFGQRFQYQVNYTFAKAQDDASDVFDLAGSPALPQNSLDTTFATEYGPANFDARHRFAYNFTYELPSYSDRDRAYRWILGGLQISGTGRFQTGQPFTVNSIFDVNLDGNLTDRLNSLSSGGAVINATGDRQHPLTLTGNPLLLLAAPGRDGAIGRNTFRAGSIMELDLSIAKRFEVREGQSFSVRMDIFNFTNRANFGVPVRFLEAPGFGSATDTVTPGRRIQFALRYDF